MKKCYREELVGVFGMPVDENPTVVIQEAAFKALGLPFRYLTIEVRPEDLGKAMDGMRAMNMRGINITMPYKTTVLQYLDHVADDAKLMGAVNTIYSKDGKLYGENTDGKGFITSLQKGGVSISGKRVVLLGAGGVARAISVELANAGAEYIQIVNASEERGMVLTELLNENTPVKAEFHLWTGTYSVLPDTDILVNGTSVGFLNSEECPDIDYDTVTKDMIVCDVIATNANTRFLEEAKNRGARTFDGFTMLVYQGALGFELWTGKEAPVEVMANALKAEMAGA